MSVYKDFIVSLVSREVIISLGRPTLLWDVYFLFAKAAWHALSPFLVIVLSNWAHTHMCVKHIPVSINISPHFLEELANCNDTAWIKTLWDKGFCSDKPPICGIAVTWKAKDNEHAARENVCSTHNTLHISRASLSHSAHNETAARKGRCVQHLQ